jgi:hypothetical protein
VNCFAASVLVAISANLWRIAWNLPIGRPKASRSLAYSSVFSIIRSPRVAAGGGDQALALELPGDVVEALALLAEHASAGTRTSSKASSPVSEACIPIFSSSAETVKPGTCSPSRRAGRRRRA